jgi:hypothetical protein
MTPLRAWSNVGAVPLECSPDKSRKPSPRVLARMPIRLAIVRRRHRNRHASIRQGFDATAASEFGRLKRGPSTNRIDMHPERAGSPLNLDACKEIRVVTGILVQVPRQRQNLICNGARAQKNGQAEQAKICVTRIGESLVARDIIHLTPVGSDFLVNSIAPALGIAD